MQSKNYIREVKEADLAVCERASSFLQCAMWGEFKSRFGWKASAFLIDWDFADEASKDKSPLLALSRRLAPGFSFTYIPWGPVFPPFFLGAHRLKAAAQLAVKLKPFLARNTAFIRFEPPWEDSIDNDLSQQGTDGGGKIILNGGQDAISREFLASGFRPAAASVQAPDTVVVALDASPEDILSRMKPKWRYNISLAEKKGVRVESFAGGMDCGAKDLKIFYDLLKETAQRDGIAVHSFDYYKTLFELCEKERKDKLNLRLYTARHESEVLAAIVVLFRGKDAVYLYGASSNNKRNLMAPYALQWRAMQDAKRAGCQYYDLFGIPPNEDPNHPMAGLYRFKTGFGGRFVRRPGGWDFPYKPLIYIFFSAAEKFRKKIRDRKKLRNKKFNG